MADANNKRQQERSTARNLFWSRWVLQTARKPTDLDLLHKHTGVYLMERYHRQLTTFILENNQIIDQFDEAPIGVRLIERQAKLFQELLDFVTEQFDREEWLIEQYEMRNPIKQREQHQQFISTIQGMIKDFEGGKLKIGLQLKLYLQDWMITHSAKLDYVTFNLKHWRKNIVDHAQKWEHVAMFIHNLGITQIDLDHKVILESILEFNQNVKDHHGDSPKGLVGEFQLVLSRIAEHFNREEVLIRHFDLKQRQEHLSEHRGILDKLLELRDLIATGSRKALEEVRQQSLLIWIDHINEVDAISFAPDEISGTVAAQISNWDEMSYFVRPTSHEWVNEGHKAVIDKILKLVPVINDFFNNDARLDDVVQDVCYLLQKVTETLNKVFEVEDQWLAEHRPIHWERHLRSHEHLRKSMMEYRSHLKMGVVAFSPKVKAMLLGEWITHINEEDFEVFGTLDLSY